MEIFINNQPRTIAPGTTLAELVAQLEIPTRFLAVERNLSVVPLSTHSTCRLEPGDRLEIVTLVGGG